MNILYINHYAGAPQYGMEFRPYYMAREWLATGHDVRILAADISHVRAKQPITHGKKTSENIDGVTYTWYPTPNYAGNGVGRVKNIFAFLWQVFRDSKDIIKQFAPDVVIASSTYPLDIWLAKYIAKQAKAKLVFEVHDLWPLSPIELGGMSAKHPFIMLCQAAENYAYKHADRVVSMLPKVQQHMAAHGLDLTKLSIIPNGIVAQDWQAAAIEALADNKLRDFLDLQTSQGKIIVGYAGSHGKPNALNYLLAAAALTKNDKLIFVLVGSGLEKANLIALKNNQALNNVYFFDPIPKKQIPSLLQYFDIAYIGWHKSAIYRFGISPNKLMDYMMAAVAVLHSVDAGNDPVTEAQCGLTVAPENAAAIAAGIEQLAALPQIERETMGQKGREFILKNQTYSVLAAEFIQAMQ